MKFKIVKNMNTYIQDKLLSYHYKKYIVFSDNEIIAISPTADVEDFLDYLLCEKIIQVVE